MPSKHSDHALPPALSCAYFPLADLRLLPSLVCVLCACCCPWCTFDVPLVFPMIPQWQHMEDVSRLLGPTDPRPCAGHTSRPKVSAPCSLQTKKTSQGILSSPLHPFPSLGREGTGLTSRPRVSAPKQKKEKQGSLELTSVPGPPTLSKQYDTTSMLLY